MCTIQLIDDAGLPIRLANGVNEKEGRVEIYWNNQWGTVCDDVWDDNDATVVCKQLGYSGGSARVSAYFGKGSGLILLDNVNCYGGESSIFDCRQKSFSVHDCEHHEDAGVVCYGESSKGTYVYKLYVKYISFKANVQMLHIINPTCIMYAHWLLGARIAFMKV